MKNALPTALAAALLLTALAGCKKDEPTPDTPTDPNGEPAAVSVLRDGAGFTQYISKPLKVAQGVGGSAGTLTFFDFSLDNSNQLHLLYQTAYTSQQSTLKTTARSIYNLGTKAPVAVPSPDEMTASTQSSDLSTQTVEFLPYTGNVAAFLNNGAPYGYASQGRWGGYLTSTLPSISNGGGYYGGVGLYNVFTTGYTAYGPEDYMTVNPTPAAIGRVAHLNLVYKTPAMQAAYLANFPEPRYGAQGPSVAITVAANAVEAYKFALVTPVVYTRTGRLTPSGLTRQPYTTQRRYSADGTRLAMLVRGDTDKKCWTYTYNFATDVLAANLSNVDLPYSAAGSDIDLDEDGNVYYTGVAGNGTKAGVSVYKRTATGTAVVGTDDFLKFGEVVKLHYYNGKVHMAVQGKITGREPWSQLCFLAQN